MDWNNVIFRLAAEAESRLDRARREIDRRIGRERPVRVLPYRGYGTPERVRVRGRVVHGTLPTPARPEDRWWVNLTNAWRRLESDEVPGARLRVAFRGAEVETVTDEEGHFVAEVVPAIPVPRDMMWHDAHVELLDPPGETVAVTVAVPQRPRFGVISTSRIVSPPATTFATGGSPGSAGS